MFENDLEILLEDLFGDESTPEDIAVLKGCTYPPEIFDNCCTYNYTGYGG